MDRQQDSPIGGSRTGSPATSISLPSPRPPTGGSKSSATCPGCGGRTRNREVGRRGPAGPLQRGLVAIPGRLPARNHRGEAGGSGPGAAIPHPRAGRRPDGPDRRRQPPDHPQLHGRGAAGKLDHRRRGQRPSAVRRGGRGKLKICGLDPHLAEIFSIVGMARQLELHADEAEAIDSPWPRSSSHRALPVDIMAALTTAASSRRSAAARPMRGPSRGSAGLREPARGLERTARPSHREAHGPSGCRSRPGRARSGRVPVSGARFVIGRERGCQLRLGSAQVSKHHAAIERRRGGSSSVDLGSTNGTMVGGRLHPRPGGRDRRRRSDPDRADRLDPVDRSRGEAAPRRWRITPRSGCRSKGNLAATGRRVALDGRDALSRRARPRARIKCEVIQEVLVVTPQWPEMDNEATNEALRQRLIDAVRAAAPAQGRGQSRIRGHISRQTIANLLAHHFRLDRGRRRHADLPGPRPHHRAPRPGPPDDAGRLLPDARRGRTSLVGPHRWDIGSAVARRLPDPPGARGSCRGRASRCRAPGPIPS